MINIFTDGFKINQGFGKENTSPDYLAWYEANNLLGHEGVDIIPANKFMDWRVFAKYEGKVVKVNNKCDNAYGKYVTVWTKRLNCAFQYCHLSDVKVKVGDKILAKRYIGDMGGTAMAEDSLAPHTHVNKIPVNRFGYRNGDKNNGYKGLVDPTPDLL